MADESAVRHGTPGERPLADGNLTENNNQPTGGGSGRPTDIMIAVHFGATEPATWPDQVR